MIQPIIIIFLCIAYPVIGLGLVVAFNMIACETHQDPLDKFSEAAVVLLWPFVLILLITRAIFMKLLEVR